MNNNATSILEFASSLAIPNQKTFVTSNSATAQRHFYETSTTQSRYSIVAGDSNKINGLTGISGISGMSGIPATFPPLSGLIGMPAVSGISGSVGGSGISGFNPLDPLFNGSSTEKLLNERIQKQCEEFAKKHHLIYSGDSTARQIAKNEKTNLDVYRKSLENLGFDKFEPFEFQKKLFQNFEANDNIVIRSQRQMGISTCLAIFALHHALNNEGSQIRFIVSDRKNIKKIANMVGLLDKSLTYESNFVVTVENFYEQILQFKNKSCIFIEVPSAIPSVYYDVFTPQTYVNMCDVLISDNAFDFFNMDALNNFHNTKQKIIITSSKEKYKEKYNNEHINNFGEMFWLISNNITIFKPINVRWEMHPDRTDEWAKGQIEKLGVREFVKQFGNYYPPITIKVGNIDKKDVPNFVAGEMNSIKGTSTLNSDRLSIKDYPVLKYEPPMNENEWDINKPRIGRINTHANERLWLREVRASSELRTDGYVSSGGSDKNKCQITLGDRVIIDDMDIADKDILIEMLKICNAYIELKSKK